MSRIFAVFLILVLIPMVIPKPPQFQRFVEKENTKCICHPTKQFSDNCGEELAELLPNSEDKVHCRKTGMYHCPAIPKGKPKGATQIDECGPSPCRRTFRNNIPGGITCDKKVVCHII